MHMHLYVHKSTPGLLVDNQVCNDVVHHSSSMQICLFNMKVVIRPTDPTLM